MAAMRANKIVSIPLLEAIARNRTVDDETIQIVDGLLPKAEDRATASR